MDVLTVDTLAEVLQEPNRPLLTQVLQILGPDRTTAVLTDTLHWEAHGGLLTTDGTRRRTPGGSRRGRTNAGASSPGHSPSTARDTPRPPPC